MFEMDKAVVQPMVKHICNELGKNYCNTNRWQVTNRQ